MLAFADLLERLILTPSRNTRVALLRDYLARTPDPSRGWALAAIMGELKLPGVKPGVIRALIEARMDPVLFRLCYEYVGDLAETVSLVWPDSGLRGSPPPLDLVVGTLMQASRTEGARLTAMLLDPLDPRARWALLKLITGGLRVGVSAGLARTALAELGDQPVAAIEEIWHGLEPPYLDLFAWLEGRGERPAPRALAPFRPVMLAHPLIPKSDRGDPDALDPDLIGPDAYAAEWKWDGIRVQLACEGGARRLYTRTGEDISHTFPDVIAAMEFEGVLDGELLVRREDGAVAEFNALQQRLNRKSVSAKEMARFPAFLRAYDLLAEGQADWRARPFRERRARLEAFLARHGGERLDLSALVTFADLPALAAARAAPPSPEIEGVMLKRWDSAYLAGRPKGAWFKWKRDPFLVDAVMMYARHGHGKRSGFFSDFTFGVWDGEALTPVGQAYSGFTDAELTALDRYVRENTLERFGPVRRVRAEPDHGIVLEIAFEGLQRSPRHKSGLAMRFPRIHRIRWDKPPAQADGLAVLTALLRA